MNAVTASNTNNLAARIRKNWREGRLVFRAARDHGGAWIPTFLELLRLYGIRRYSLREIAGYDLLHKDSPVRILVSKRESLDYLARINPSAYACLVENKIVFEAICAANDLPIPKRYGSFVKGKAFLKLQNPVNVGAQEPPQLPDEFIVKPADGVYGHSIVAWARAGEYWVANDGRRQTAAELNRNLVEASRAGALVLQQRVQSHPAITNLSGFTGAQTLRLVSLRNADKDGDVDLLFGNLKLLGHATLTDNFSFGHSGNLLCPIDVATGTVSRALYRDSLADRLALVSHHPNTGKALEGFQIPYWAEVKDLARQAADAFFLLPTIGWDIVITPDGPLLIEGNARWDPSVAPKAVWDRIGNVSRVGSYR